MFINFLLVVSNNLIILIDGTDGEIEGTWKFETTDETPYIPEPIRIDETLNCLKIISATEIGHTLCHRQTTARTTFCEYEGMVQPPHPHPGWRRTVGRGSNYPCISIQ